jgi:hypothetical protein
VHLARCDAALPRLPSSPCVPRARTSIARAENGTAAVMPPYHPKRPPAEPARPPALRRAPCAMPRACACACACGCAVLECAWACSGGAVPACCSLFLPTSRAAASSRRAAQRATGRVGRPFDAAPPDLNRGAGLVPGTQVAGRRGPGSGGGSNRGGAEAQLAESQHRQKLFALRRSASFGLRTGNSPILIGAGSLSRLFFIIALESVL